MSVYRDDFDPAILTVEHGAQDDFDPEILGAAGYSASSGGATETTDTDLRSDFRDRLRHRLRVKDSLLNKIGYVKKRTKDDKPDAEGLTLGDYERYVMSSDFNTLDDGNLQLLADAIDAKHADVSKRDRSGVTGVARNFGRSLKKGYSRWGTYKAMGENPVNKAIRRVHGGPWEVDEDYARALHEQHAEREETMPTYRGGVEDIRSVSDAVNYALGGVAENLPSSLEQMGMATVGTIVGGPIAGRAFQALSGYDSNYGEAVSDQIEDGVDKIDFGLARNQALGYSAVDYAFSGAGYLGRRLGGKVAKKPLEEAKKSFVKNVWGVAKEALKAGGEEAINEPLQSQVVGRIRRKVQTGSALRENETGGDVFSETVNEALGGFLNGLILGGASSGIEYNVYSKPTMRKADFVIEKLSQDIDVDKISGYDKKMVADYMMGMAALPQLESERKGEKESDAQKRKKVIDAIKGRQAEIMDAADSETRAIITAYESLFTNAGIESVPDSVKPTFNAEKAYNSKIEEADGSETYFDEDSGIMIAGKEGDWSVFNRNGMKMPLSDNTAKTLKDAIAYAEDLSRLNQWRIENNVAKSEFIRSMAQKNHPNANVVMVDSPTDIKDNRVKARFIGGEQGFYNPADNTVYLMLDAVQNPAQAAILLEHESFHAWFENMLRAENKTRKEVLGTDSKAEQVKIEEALAEAYAKRDSDPGRYSSWVRAVQKWIRDESGVDTQVTDADIRMLLQKVSSRDKAGGKRWTGAQIEYRPESAWKALPAIDAAKRQFDLALKKSKGDVQKALKLIDDEKKKAAAAEKKRKADEAKAEKNAREAELFRRSIEEADGDMDKARDIYGSKPAELEVEQMASGNDQRTTAKQEETKSLDARPEGAETGADAQDSAGVEQMQADAPEETQQATKQPPTLNELIDEEEQMVGERSSLRSKSKQWADFNKKRTDGKRVPQSENPFTTQIKEIEKKLSKVRKSIYEIDPSRKPVFGQKQKKESFGAFFDAKNQDGEYDLLQWWHQNRGLFGAQKDKGGGEHDAYRHLPKNMRQAITWKSKGKIDSVVKELAEVLHKPEYADTTGPDALVSDWVYQYNAYQRWKEEGAPSQKDLENRQYEEYEERIKAEYEREHEQEQRDLATYRQMVDNGDVIEDGHFVAIREEAARAAGIDPAWPFANVAQSYVRNDALVYEVGTPTGDTLAVEARDIDADLGKETEVDDDIEGDIFERAYESSESIARRLQEDRERDNERTEQEEIERETPLQGDRRDESEVSKDEGGKSGEEEGRKEDLNLESATPEELAKEARKRADKKALEEGAAKQLTGTAGDLTPDMFGEGDTPLFNERRDTQGKDVASHKTPSGEPQRDLTPTGETQKKERPSTDVSKKGGKVDTPAESAKETAKPEQFRRGEKIATVRNADGVSYFGEVIQENPDGTVKIRAFKEKRKGTIAAKPYGVDAHGNRITKEIDVPAASVKSVEARPEYASLTQAERYRLKLARQKDEKAADKEVRAGEYEAAPDIGDKYNAYRDSKGQRKTDNYDEDDGQADGDIRFRRSGVTPEMDKAYMDAVKRGDMETAQRMVDEAAKAAGYVFPATHLTNKLFTKFDIRKATDKLGRQLGYGWGRGKFYFTYGHDSQLARSDRPRKINAFLKIEKPIDESEYERMVVRHAGVSSIFDIDPGKIRDKAFMLADKDIKSLGYDGIISGYLVDGYNQIAVFSPSQIKSADPVTYDDAGNVIPLSERFNDASDDVRFRRATSGTPATADSLDTETRFDAFRRKIQDYMLPWKRAIEGIAERTGKRVLPGLDVYHAESRSYGLTRNQVQHIEKDYIEPAEKTLKDNGISVDEFDLYLKAKAGPDRNRMIAERTDGENLTGSGRSDAYWANVLAAFDRRGMTAALEQAGQHVWDMNRHVLDLKVKHGLMSKAQADVWKAMSPFYVPLRDDDADADYTGTGKRASFSLKRKESQSATGRREGHEADSPFAFSIMQALEAVQRANKNRVVRTAARLARANPSDLWRIETRIPTKKAYDADTGKVISVPDTKFEDAPNVVVFKHNGKKQYLVFDGEDGMKLAQSLKRDSLQRAPAAVSALTRVFAAMRTAWVPTFILRNLRADLLQLTLNMSAEEKARMVPKVFKNMLSSWKAVWTYERDGVAKGALAGYANEYFRNGGQIAGVGVQTVDKIGRTLHRHVNKRNAFTGSKPVILAEHLYEYVERANAAIETGTRLALYAAMRKKGASIRDAVNESKNITVDFNRKGELGPIINSLYMFSNVSIQDTARSIKALSGKNGMKVIAGLIGAGFLASMMNNGGDDDDDDKSGDKSYKNLSESEKQRNIVIKVGGKYVKQPIRGLWAWIYYIGTKMGDVVCGEYDPRKAALDVTEAALDTINFLGTSGSAWQFAAPTLVDPVVQHLENKDWKGDPQRQRKFNDAQPDSSTGMKRTPNWIKATAKGLNRMTGGDEYTKGWIDLAPETIKHVIDTLLGGVGTDISYAADTAINAAKGEFDVDKMPFVRDFFRDMPDSTRRYYEAKDRFEHVLYRLNNYSGEKKRKLRREYPYLKPRPAERIKNLNKTIKELREKEQAAKTKEERERHEKRRLRLQATVLRLVEGDEEK